LIFTKVLKRYGSMLGSLLEGAVMLFSTRPRLRYTLSAGLLIASLGSNSTIGAANALRVAELVTACGRSTVIAANHVEADGAGKIRLVANAFRMTNALLAFINHFRDGGTTPYFYNGLWGAIDARVLIKSLQGVSSDVIVSNKLSPDRLASFGTAEGDAPSTAQEDAVLRPPVSSTIYAMWQQPQIASGAAVSAGSTTVVSATPNSVVGSAPVTAQAVTPVVATGSVPVAVHAATPAVVASSVPVTEQEADKTVERIAQVLLSDILPAIETAASVGLAVDGMLDKPEDKKLRICLQSLISWSRTLQACFECRNTPEARMYLVPAVAHTLLTVWEVFRNYGVPSVALPVANDPVSPTLVQPVAVLPVAPTAVATNPVVADSSAANATSPAPVPAPAQTPVVTSTPIQQVTVSPAASSTVVTPEVGVAGTTSTPVEADPVAVSQPAAATTAVADSGALQGAPVRPAARRVVIPPAFLSATAAPMNSALAQAPTGQRRVIFGNGLSVMVNDGNGANNTKTDTSNANNA
jgi:hypothetical protein